MTLSRSLRGVRSFYERLTMETSWLPRFLLRFFSRLARALSLSLSLSLSTYFSLFSCLSSLSLFRRDPIGRKRTDARTVISLIFFSPRSAARFAKKSSVFFSSRDTFHEDQIAPLSRFGRGPPIAYSRR